MLRTICKLIIDYFEQQLEADRGVPSEAATASFQYNAQNANTGGLFFVVFALQL